MKSKSITIFPNVNGDMHPAKSNVGKVAKFNSLEELNKHIVSSAWSPSVFANNNRKNENFIYTNVMALDFDENADPADIRSRLIHLGFDYSITLTRNHMKQKGTKAPCSRFRVVIPLEEKIESQQIFSSTWLWLQEQFPEVDGQCKDPARFYFASTNGVWRNR